MYREYECLQTELEDGILIVKLSRGKLNSYNKTMSDEITDIVQRASEDDEVKAVIFTGDGKYFCAGADLVQEGGAFEYKDMKPEQHRDIAGRHSMAMYDCKKPLIAAINGAAVGVGITMTLPMDVRICSNTAKMGFVFVKRGVLPEACSSWFLPRIVGLSKALEWVLTGRVFSADEALRYGLVTEVLEPDELLPRAKAIAREFADNSHISVMLTRQMFLKNSTLSSPYDAYKNESMNFYWTSFQPDKKEGIDSFLEKREANYTMKPSTDVPEFYPWWEIRND